MKKVKIISLILIFLIIFSTFSGIVQANISEGENASTEENNQANNSDINNMFKINGFIEEENNVDIDEFLIVHGNEEKLNGSDENDKLPQEAGNQNIPEAFDLRDKIKINVESQNGGLCWDFAALGALRTYLALKQGEGTETPNLSERHLDLFTSKYCDKEFSRELEQGGNFSLALEYFKNNDGPILEEDCPQDMDIDVNNKDLIQELDSLNPSYYVHEIIKFPSLVKEKKSDGTVQFLNNDKVISESRVQQIRNLIKQHIMKNGGLCCSIRTNESFIGNNLGDPYDTYEGKWSQYDDGSIENSECGSHAVTIVGWDDNYSKDKFNVKNSEGQIVHPHENGAYLILNSHGPDNYEEGYQWVSYEDYKVEKDVMGYVNVDETENMYEYTFTNKSTYDLMKEKLAQYGNIEINDNTKTIKVLDLIVNSVEELDLKISDLTDLDISDIFKYNMKNLKTLNLNDNKITDITVLNKLTNLISLDLGSNSIKDISPLSKLINLTSLDIYNNKIEDISPISKLTKLNEMNASNNKIEDISPISKLTKLNEMNASNNKIEDISSISNLTNLKFLILSENNIKDISALAKLTKLNSLYIYTNKIEDISVLGNLSNLEKLDISKNHISNIAPIANLTKLWSLSIKANNISDFSSLNLSKYIVLEISRQQLSENVSTKIKLIDYPALLKNAKELNNVFYSEDGFEFSGCSENPDGTGIVLDENIKTAQVKIKSGKLKNTVWTINVEESNSDKNDSETGKDETKQDGTNKNEANKDETNKDERSKVENNKQEKSNTNIDSEDNQKNDNISSDNAKSNDSKSDSTSSTIEKNEYLSPKKLPQTGPSHVLIITMLGVMTISTIVFGGLYIKYKKFE